MIVEDIALRFRASSAFRAVRRELAREAGGARATNLAGSSKSVLAAALAEDLDVPVLVVAPSAERGEAWLADLESLLGEGRVGWYPQWEILPYEPRAPQREIEGQRLEFLAGLLESSVRVGVTTVRAAIQKILPPSALEDRLLRVSTGDKADLEELARRLVGMGFEREAMVAEVGTFSIRGGIVDVFGYRYPDPVRLELADDRVESIRAFDLATQRSLSPLDRVEILPARERPSELGVEAAFGGEGQAQARAAAPTEMTPLAAWLHPDTLVVRDEPARVAAATGEAWEEVLRRHAEVSEEREVPAPDALWLDPEAFERALADYSRLDLEALHMQGDDGAIRFATREPEPVQRSMKRLAEVLRHDLAAGVLPVVLCDNLGQLERLEELLPADVRDARLVVGALEGGFRMTDAALAVYTDHEIFDRRRRVRRRRRYAAGVSVEHLTRIEPGDYLVHMDYGIGQYEGLERLRLSGDGEVEALKLRYAEDEALYIPVEQLARVEKFTSEDGRPPTIHRLGSGHWERQKAKTEAAIQQLADELLELQARRETAPGFAFSPDTQWQREMESAFLYEDTLDQRAAAEAVKRDMERPRPMDRLVCGDVGYGKTEIAIRAAFKAVQDGKQVAVLVPTTVLAIQHLETFRERLADFPVDIRALSRFNTAAESRVVVKGVADGTVDIVIGTHRLLSKDVEFADLGLVVIDEEQRFGVRHKQRLRQLRASVDVLTLTATPIPRTLQMSLMGLREMSLIETPPRDRTPIVTWVSEFDEELVEEAIRREVDRGGQVFYVHNRVQTIEAARKLIEALAPEVRVAVSHGQMPEKELEQVMVALFHHEIDVLVTSTIIESGLDVPNANTMVVARADRFGLADLYQLRGRVGRSHHRAYCYLLTPPRDAMTTEAEKRLRVLEEHTDLGAGYRIALHDLEMRGAGNLLGADQSGFIAAVGFETYLRLLEETIQGLKGEVERPVREPELAFDADAFLPDRYVPDAQQRLALYRRLSRLRDPAAIDDFRQELEDRYGPLPPPAAHLLDAVHFKTLAARAGLARIRIRPSEARAELRWPPGIEPRLKAIQRSAEARGAEIEVQGLDPFRLALTAADYGALRETLAGIVGAFEVAA
jgi:transcription-repair coupling factor (superfamily II helicase)